MTFRMIGSLNIVDLGTLLFTKLDRASKRTKSLSMLFNTLNADLLRNFDNASSSSLFSIDIMFITCLDFARRLGGGASKRISVARLATEAGGVGNAFKIGEGDLTRLLAEACQTADYARMENVNGAQHLVFGDPEEVATRALGVAYGRKLPRPASRQEVLVT